MAKKILRQVHVEATDIDPEDVQDLLDLAAQRNVPLEWSHDKAHAMYEEDIAGAVEGIAQCFEDAGFPVDYHDGAFITIYERA